MSTSKKEKSLGKTNPATARDQQVFEQQDSRQQDSEQQDSEQQAGLPARPDEEEDGTPILDDNDLAENRLSEEDAEDIDWEPAGDTGNEKGAAKGPHKPFAPLDKKDPEKNSEAG